MSIVPITMCGDKILRKKAAKVSEIDDNIVGIITDMFETMRNANGVGLAANQIGLNKQIFVVDVSPVEGYEKYKPIAKGIVHSLECAKIFADSIPDYNRYTKSELARFTWMKKERETLDYFLSPAGKNGPRLQDRWRLFRNARRSGIGLPMLDALRNLGPLLHWVENTERGF